MKFVALNPSIVFINGLLRRFTASWFICLCLSYPHPTAAQTGSDEKSNHNLSEVLNFESDPIAFAPSYIGFILNQNQPSGFGLQTWSSGGPSWGAEYRFFYKDHWSLSVSGSFKQLYGVDKSENSLFALSQESTRITRLYHPIYVGIGGRLSYLVPVNKIEIPYTRDQSRLIDTGAGLGLSMLMITDKGLVTSVSAHRWRSLSTTRRQGFELSITALVSIR